MDISTAESTEAENRLVAAWEWEVGKKWEWLVISECGISL